MQDKINKCKCLNHHTGESDACLCPCHSPQKDCKHTRGTNGICDNCGKQVSMIYHEPSPQVPEWRRRFREKFDDTEFGINRKFIEQFISEELSKQFKDHLRILEESKKMSFEQGWKRCKQEAEKEVRNCILAKYNLIDFVNSILTSKSEQMEELFKNCERREDSVQLSDVLEILKK